MGKQKGPVALTASGPYGSLRYSLFGDQFGYRFLELGSPK